jgi:ABC-type dipeptide/oligopeptide/nickel transport system permease subunit
MPAELVLQGTLARGKPSKLAESATWALRHPLGVLGLLLVLALGAMAATAGVVATHDPQDLGAAANLGMSSQHYLGTDPVGKDVFSLLFYGARVSLAVGLTAVLLGVSAGALLGLVSGYVGGLVDLLGQRLIDALAAFPAIIKALVLMAILGPSPTNVVIALAVSYVPQSTRITRSVVLREKATVYADAARAMGATPLRIMLRHILPNSIAPYLVLVSVTVGQAIVAEASLSFLGAGVGPEVPSWGVMLSIAARSYFDTTPALAVAPGLAISTAVLGFNLFGDAVRDTLDPRLRRGRGI